MKRIVTDRDLEEQAREGVFHVTRDMILTPFARDFAVNHGIRLEREVEGGPSGSDETGSAAAEISDQVLDQAIREIVLAELSEATHDAPVAPIDEGSVTPSDLQPFESDGKNAVITTTGLNRTGIIAEITRVISEGGGDIRDISQTIVAGYFTMIAVVDISGLGARGTTFHAFRERLLDVARDLGVDLNVMHEDILRTMHRI